MNALSLVAVHILIILYLVKKLATVQPQLQVPVIVQTRPVVEVRRDPEFRGAPYKQYKPRTFQQMGVLLGGEGEVLPLYGRESPGYRDRYQYYTTTPGEQIYPLPITQGDRECTEDIGCPEFYGNEDVSVLGKTGTYKVNMYETEQLYY